MIESILEEPLAIARQRMAPLVKEREQFLSTASGGEESTTVDCGLSHPRCVC